MIQEHPVVSAEGVDFARLITEWHEIEEIQGLGEFQDLGGDELVAPLPPPFPEP